MKQLTVFTPTFNRAYCLHQVYESLLKQTNPNFIWMIIDDGSIDATKDLVAHWIESNLIEIIYIFQQNQGMHGAHNTAYANITTTYNVCIDSDDYLTIDAVGIILEQIIDLDTSKFAGLLALDADKFGVIIGTKIPDFLRAVKLHELYIQYKMKGDKKIVLKTDIANKFPPYPLFKNERFVPLDYKYLMINQTYYFKPVNSVFCVVEYQSDGSTMNIFKQYRKNPKGFAFSRISRINYVPSINNKIRNSIHLVSSIIFSKDSSDLFKTKYTIIVLMCIPFGVLLNLYIRFKTVTRK